MTISDIKKSTIVLHQTQLFNIKGGSDSADDTDIIIMDDVDAL